MISKYGDVPWREDLPELRRCHRCREWKKVREEFTSRITNTNAHGITRMPLSYCKKCEAIRIREWEANQPDGRRAYKAAEQRRRYRRSAARRQYLREYQRMKRALAGKKIRGPRDPKERDARLALVPVEPFVEWWHSLNGNRPSEDRMGEALSRAVRRAVNGDQDSADDISKRRMRLDVVDEVGVMVGQPHLIYLLYT